MPYVQQWSEYRVEDADGTVRLENRDMQRAADFAHSIGGVVYEDTYAVILTAGDVIVADYREKDIAAPTSG